MNGMMAYAGVTGLTGWAASTADGAQQSDGQGDRQAPRLLHS